jgi:hypothetical protein
MNSDTEKVNEREHSEDKDTGNQLLPSINSNLQEIYFVMTEIFTIL